MKHEISRRSFLSGAAMFAAITATGLSGCGSNASSGTTTVKIGTMPTEDILPMWVAEQNGYFKAHGVDAQVVSFDSAQNLSAAITSKQVDLAMTDPMRALSLCASGTPVTMEWITLGTTAKQGRFGILTSADSGFKTLADLKKGTKGVGLASNTVPEYVFDKLCEQDKIDPSKIKVSEVAALPQRYSLVASGKLDAAALPNSLLVLGKASGMVILADDTKGENISQSVMVVRKEFNTGEGATKLQAIRNAWDDAIKAINANPESFRTLLASKANLNSKIATTYPMSTYPSAMEKDGTAAYPPAKLITPQITWMQTKGYLNGKTATYNQANGSFEVA